MNIGFDSLTGAIYTGIDALDALKTAVSKGGSTQRLIDLANGKNDGDYSYLGNLRAQRTLTTASLLN
mgnify:CR=1 FL=1